MRTPGLIAFGIALSLLVPDLTCAAEQSPVPRSLRKQLMGLRYPEARAKLLAQGWQPAMIKRAEPQGAERWFIEQGYAEVESCSEGEVVCSFLYNDAEGGCLHVTTQGAGARAKVEHLDRRCFR